MAPKSDKKKKKPNIVRRTLTGHLLSVDFIIRHWKAVGLCMFMVLAYITNRYQCLTRMEQIRHLRQELQIVETERIREKSTYMSRIRESSMQEMVDTMHLHLSIQDQPPYRLK